MARDADAETINFNETDVVEPLRDLTCKPKCSHSVAGSFVDSDSTGKIRFAGSRSS